MNKFVKRGQYRDMRDGQEIQFKPVSVGALLKT